MKFWPWSRFTKYEAELDALCARFHKAELAELTTSEELADAKRRLDVAELSRKRMHEHHMQLNTKLSKANTDLITLRAQFSRLEAELNSKMRTSVVLHPPTQHVKRKEEQQPPASREVGLEYDGNALGDHEPLEGFVRSGWPFPTAYLGE